MPPLTLLILNPNSSPSITSSLATLLVPPPNVALAFLTGPADEAPLAIVDDQTAEASATACARMLAEEERALVERCDGVLVCCFSDHPLVPLLQQTLAKPVLGMFDASLALSLLLGRRFAILTTVGPMVPGLEAGVGRFLGAGGGGRFAGAFASGLGVLELHDEQAAERVAQTMRATAGACRRAGADVVVLGCAGMSGMEGLVRAGYAQDGGDGGQVKVVDGVKAGVEMLVALCRMAC